MKKVLLFFAPLLIAVIIFFGILFFLDKEVGKGALQVTSVPQSTVYLDGKLVGKTPFCMGTDKCEIQEGIDMGEHNIKLVPADTRYLFYETKIPINKLTLTAVDRTFAEDGGSEGSIISLSPLNSKEDVEILVVSWPDKANVFLDNNPVGITPLLLKQVSVSDHDLRVTRDGYKDKSLKIRTTAKFKLNSLILLGVSADLSNPVSASSSGIAASPTPATVKVLILNTGLGYLNVRESSAVYSAKIGEVTPGESYELVSEAEGWFEIKLDSPAGEGKMGWISSSYAVKE